MPCLRVCLMVICEYFLAFAVFGCLQGVAASVLLRRDTPLATVDIPLTVNKDRRYIVGVNMSTADPQSFNFALIANTGYSAVAGVACNGCDGVPTYNASASTSETPFPGSANITLGSATISGSFVKENCSLHEANGTAWQYPNQTIVVANTSSSLFSDVTSGLIGLGTNANGQTGDFYDTIFGGWLVRNPSQNNFTFGMDLKPPIYTSDDDQGNGGVLHWVEPDSSAYQGNIQWLTVSVSSGSSVGSGNVSDVTSNTVSGLELPESDWSIEMDGWAASISGTAVANTTASQTLIEPFFPDIIFPVSQADLLYAAVPSAVKTSSLVDGAQTWTIPCDTSLSVAFSFGGQSFPLDQTQLIEQQSNGSCIGTIKAWPDESIGNFMFGSNFISAFYLIYIIGRPGSGVPNSIGMGSKATKESSGTPVGAIVGGTVGGVVGVAILVGGAYWLGHRHQRKLLSSGIITNAAEGEKENYTSTKNEDRSEEGGAQYANYSLPHYGPQKYSPTTPFTGNSAQPLLHDGQYPQSHPLPNTQHLHAPLSNFLAMSTGASSDICHAEEPSGTFTSVGSRISYNPQAFAANMTTSSRGPPILGSIEPFVLPPASGANAGSGSAGYDRPRKFIQEHSTGTPVSARLPEVFNPRPADTSVNLSSPQDIDPFSPSTISASGGGTIQPFILAPVPESAVVRSPNARAKGSPRPAAPHRSPHEEAPPETPAPPYTAHVDDAISPTLVEVGSSLTQDSSVPREENI